MMEKWKNGKATCQRRSDFDEIIPFRLRYQAQSQPPDPTHRERHWEDNTDCSFISLYLTTKCQCLVHIIYVYVKKNMYRERARERDECLLCLELYRRKRTHLKSKSQAAAAGRRNRLWINARLCLHRLCASLSSFAMLEQLHSLQSA